MENKETETGFSNHVQSQLMQAAQQVSQNDRARNRGRGRGRRAHGFGHHNRGNPDNPGHTVHPHIPVMNDLPQKEATGPTHVQPDFNQTTHAQPPPQRHNPYLLNHNTHVPQTPPREFFDRARGWHRGGRYQANQAHGYHTTGQVNPQVSNSRGGPQFRGQLYQPGANAHFTNPEQQRVHRQRVMAQSDYLNKLEQETRNKFQLKQNEKQLKEDFRKRLEILFQNTITEKYPKLSMSDVRLKCYGSLNNGFGLAGCDMDLLIVLPEELKMKELDVLQNEQSKRDHKHTATGPVVTADAGNDPKFKAEDSESMADSEKFEAGLLLEASLLDSGYGARLLTRTRVPILRVCEKPSTELLDNLRENRKYEDSLRSGKRQKRVLSQPLPPPLDLTDIDAALRNLEDQETAAEIPAPASPARETVNLEFSGDCGIQCDINFSNEVAIHNTRLLREYCKYDERVAYMGVFIKAWAKTRDINTPYLGTLSSYGYILMVLHYLMNVVNPPVIPNLQALAKNEDSWQDQTNVELFEGKYDIRFWNDSSSLAEFRTQNPKNHDSAGNLLRGFFWYYAESSGFHWNNEVISIRTKGGIITKRSKGWTEAKWAPQSQNKNIRLRYLIAIEDPFETDHNVARTVGHNGLVAIRDEFRRAWKLIQQIGGEENVENLLEVVENRGDMLRKDQEFHRQKVKQMRQELEAKERALKEAAEKTSDDLGENNKTEKTNLQNDSSLLH